MTQSGVKATTEMPRTSLRHESLSVARNTSQDRSPMNAQDSFGNRGVLRRIHAKFQFSQTADPHEQEADRVAAQVMSGQTIPRIQRKCAACSGGTALCHKCKEDERLQLMPYDRGSTQRVPAKVSMPNAPAELETEETAHKVMRKFESPAH